MKGILCALSIVILGVEALSNHVANAADASEVIAICRQLGDRCRVTEHKHGYVVWVWVSGTEELVLCQGGKPNGKPCVVGITGESSGVDELLEKAAKNPTKKPPKKPPKKPKTPRPILLPLGG